jgi:hypothetical protein
VVECKKGERRWVGRGMRLGRRRWLLLSDDDDDDVQPRALAKNKEVGRKH